MNKLNGKILINFTPTGMIPTKKMTPSVPISASEIIEDIIKCAAAGANIVHIHARDGSGQPTYKRAIYQKIILAVRKKYSDLLLGVSCSGRDFPEFEKRSDVLRLSGKSKPDIASLTLSSLNFNKVASINSPDMVIKLAEKMKRRKIKPELEIFDLGMVNFAKYLIKKKLIDPPYYFNIILGNIACAQASPSHLGLILNELPENSIATVGGVGDFQHDANVAGLIFADGVRVGLEDNIFLDRQRRKLATNLELIERIIRHTHNLDKKIASHKEARLGLSLK